MSAQELCLSCGLCCDGTLFTHVPVGTEPPEQLAAAGLPVEMKEGAGPQFLQPCPAWQGGCCQVYDLRPDTCRTFRCRLLKKCEQDAVAMSDALDTVRRTQRLRDHIHDAWAALEPDAAAIGVAAMQMRIPTQEALQTDRALMVRWAPVLMPLAKMRAVIREHFHHKPSEAAAAADASAATDVRQ